MNCIERGCRNLEWRCKDCGKLACSAELKPQWIGVKTEPPPRGVKLFVIKHYVDQKFDPDEGGYRGPSFPTPSFPDIDIAYREWGWEKGGVVTHWMRVEMPQELEI